MELELLKYRVANDNEEHAWLKWLWLALMLSVPVSFLVALMRMAFGA
jgi:hypothetical protein